MAIQGLTKDGTTVEVGAPGALYQVDANEDGAEKFIELVKERAKRESADAAIYEAEVAGDLARAQQLRAISYPQGVVMSTTGSRDIETRALTTDSGQVADAMSEFGVAATALREAGYLTRAELEALSDEELNKIPGVGTGTIEKIRKPRS